jgi:hypothetical protein
MFSEEKKPKKNFVPERSRKVIPKKQVVGRLSDSTNHLYINPSLKKSFYDEPNYLSMVAYYLINSKKKYL